MIYLNTDSLQKIKIISFDKNHSLTVYSVPFMFLVFLIQIRVRVGDQSNPEKFAETHVIVTIERDQHAPKFENAPYTAQLDENVKVGMVVQTKPSSVRARDDDLKVKVN